MCVCEAKRMTEHRRIWISLVKQLLSPKTPSNSEGALSASVSAGNCFKIIMLFFSKSFDDFEIGHKTCSILVLGAIPPYNTYEKTFQVHKNSKPSPILVKVKTGFILLTTEAPLSCMCILCLGHECDSVSDRSISKHYPRTMLLHS